MQKKAFWSKKMKYLEIYRKEIKNARKLGRPKSATEVLDYLVILHGSFFEFEYRQKPSFASFVQNLLFTTK